MKMFFTVAGGLGLFLYGMQLMGDGLQKSAGDRLRKLLEMLTSVPLIGVFVGAIVTILVQSSSATTVMVVGFVNAGLMSLVQAISIILGANIGTTVTAQLISLKLTDLALPAIFAGFAISIISKSRLQRQIGQVILGFGILFLGMSVMSDGLKPLRANAVFTQYMIIFGNRPLLGIVAGAVFTALIQSSSAFTGLVVSLALQDLIGLNAAVALIFGSNIGTCVTALLASIGANLTARRAALAHLLFNVLGVFIFFPFIRPFTNIIATSASTVAHQVANAHTIFNVANTILVLPFIKQFTAIVAMLMPGTDTTEVYAPKYLDAKLIATPSVALGQVTHELLHMGEMAQTMLREVFNALRSGNRDELKYAAQKEEAINNLETEVVSYLVKVSQRSLSVEQSTRHNALLNIANDLERIGDHAQNIIELVDYKVDHGISFSEQAWRELMDMYERVQALVGMSLRALGNDDVELAKEILRKEDEIDNLEKELRRSHMNRLNEGKCPPSAGVVFLDIISNLERIADHANNIAEAVLEQ